MSHDLVYVFSRQIQDLQAFHCILSPNRLNIMDINTIKVYMFYKLPYCQVEGPDPKAITSFVYCPDGQ